MSDQKTKYTNYALHESTNFRAHVQACRERKLSSRPYGDHAFKHDGGGTQ